MIRWPDDPIFRWHRFLVLAWRLAAVIYLPAVININVQDRVATITFNRPDKLNALNAELLSASIEALRGWSKDPDVGAIVVTGAGRAFCAGGDVSAMAQPSEQSHEQNIAALQHPQGNHRLGQRLRYGRRAGHFPGVRSAHQL